MLCPLAVDYGNVADWLAATASFLAVVTALWIALGQERAAHRLRLTAKNEKHLHKAQLISEIIRITSEIESIAMSGCQLISFGGGSNGLTSNADEIGGLRLQLLALQNFPQDDPRVFGEIGRIIHESELPSKINELSTSYQKILFETIASKLAARREVLTTVLVK